MLSSLATMFSRSSIANDTNETINQSKTTSNNARRPICLVEKRGDGTLAINAQAISELRSKRQLRVITVAGPARTGKSFLLNCIAQSMDMDTCGWEFEVGDTTEACTRGIWMWGASTGSSSELDTILLDTEGLGHTAADANQDIPIFTLAVLLSSTFIFNTKGALSEQTLDSLAVIAKLAQRVTMRAGQPSSERELAGAFPTFVSVLRDFHLRLQQQGREMTSHEYLERALLDIPGGGAGRNAVRTVMRSAFPTRSCVALPFPGAEHMDHLELEECVPEFQSAMAALTDHLADITPAKRVGGRAVSGTVLAALLEAWVEALNAHAVPNVLTCLETVLGSLHARARSAALAEYERTMGKVDPASSSTAAVQACHGEALAGARRVLRLSASGDQTEDAAVRSAVTKECEQRQHALLDEVAARERREQEEKEEEEEKVRAAAEERRRAEEKRAEEEEEERRRRSVRGPFDASCSRASEVEMERWRELEIPPHGALQPGAIPGVCSTMVAVLEQEDGWDTVWRLLGQFLLCMATASTTEGCSTFKARLAAMVAQYDVAPQLEGALDTVTVALAEKLLVGFHFPIQIDEEILATSRLTDEHRALFLAQHCTDPVGGIVGVGEKTGVPNLNAAGVFTCAQLLGKALVMAEPVVSEDREQVMDVMQFYHDFIEPNVAASYKKKILHQLGEKFNQGVEIEYH